MRKTSYVEDRIDYRCDRARRSYLAEFLLGKGYVVHGIKRRASLINTRRIDHLYQDP